jgi:hypothetical protein
MQWKGWLRVTTRAAFVEKKCPSTRKGLIMRKICLILFLMVAIIISVVVGYQLKEYQQKNSALEFFDYTEKEKA